MITPTFYDCNVWIGESAEHPTAGIDYPDALVEEMDRVGVDRAVVYHVGARTRNERAGNDELVDELAEYPRLTPCWVASPTIVDEYGSVGAFVEEMHAADVRAVRMFPGEHDYRLVDEEVALLLEALQDVGAVLILDALSGILQDGFTHEELGDVCTNHQHGAFDRPSLNVVLTTLRHSIGDFSSMEKMVSAVKRVDNLHVDTARFQTHEGMRLFADECGIDRLLFGSRFPAASFGAGISSVLLSSLTDQERRQVAAGNLSRLLGETGADWNVAGRAPVRQFQSVPYEIIDIHGHVRPDGTPGEHWPDADGIVAQMDRTGIGLCCVSCLRDEEAGNDVAALAARRYPDRLVPFAVADPRWDDPRGELERCFDDLGMKMIKVHPTSHDTEPDDPAYDPVWEFANERECLVVTHARCTDRETEAFTHVATEYPDMTFMLYHAGRAWDRADNFVGIAEECPNVLLEITFSYNVDGIIEYLIEQVGPERVFFGTDLGARAPESQVGWATYARLDEADRRLHMRENALDLLDELDALPDVYREDR